MRSGRTVVVLGVLAVLASHMWSAATAADAKNSYNIRGVGIATCAKYLEARNLKKNTDAYIDWMTGFLTAYNWMKPDTFEIAPHYDPPQLSKYLDLYCGKSPKALINTAAIEFVGVMYPKRQKVRK